MGDINWIAIIVAVLGAGGIGAALRELAGVITLARKGVSGREDKRRDDIVAQRDFALAERDAAKQDARDAEDREDAERARRIRWQNYAGQVEYLAHYAGIRIDIDRPDDTTLPAHPKGSS